MQESLFRRMQESSVPPGAER